MSGQLNPRRIFFLGRGAESSGGSHGELLLLASIFVCFVFVLVVLLRNLTPEQPTLG